MPGLTPASTLVPKGGAQCVSSARWDLRGGRRATGVPTASMNERDRHVYENQDPKQDTEHEDRVEP